MKFLSFLFIPAYFLVLSTALAANVYEAPKDDINTNTNTGTFTVQDPIKRPAEKPLQMQKEEEVEVDSFGQDEFNENVDPDVLDDNDTFN